MANTNTAALYVALSLSMCINIYFVAKPDNTPEYQTQNARSTTAVGHSHDAHVNSPHDHDHAVFSEVANMESAQLTNNVRYTDSNQARVNADFTTPGATPNTQSFKQSSKELVEQVFAQYPEALVEFERTKEKRQRVREAMKSGLPISKYDNSTMENDNRDSTITWEAAQALIDDIEFPENIVDLENQFFQAETRLEREALVQQLPEWMTDQTEIIHIVSQLNLEDQQKFYEQLNGKLANWN